MLQTRQTVLFPSTEIVWFRISIGKSNDLVTVKHLRVWERIHWESTFQEVQKPSSCILFLGTIAGRFYWRSSNMGSTVYSPGKRNDDHTSHYSRGPIQKPSVIKKTTMPRIENHTLLFRNNWLREGGSP